MAQCGRCCRQPRVRFVGTKFIPLSLHIPIFNNQELEDLSREPFGRKPAAMKQNDHHPFNDLQNIVKNK